MKYPVLATALSLWQVVCISAQEDALLATLPAGFSDSSVVLLKDRLAVIPGDWYSDSLTSSIHDIKASDGIVTAALAKIQAASFLAWDVAFLEVIGSKASVETIQSFSPPESLRVHEAPVYVPDTNEFFYSDTSVTGHLWAIHVETHKVRKVESNPPLHNVNGATYHYGKVYLVTNGGSVRGLYSLNITTGETTPILNNFRGRHLNSPNDLIFDSQSKIYFTDPPYGWVQQYSGVQEPELPPAIYHFNTVTKSLTALSNSVLQMPNGIALSLDERTLYVSDTNSSYHSPTSVRNVWAFDVQGKGSILTNPRLIYQAESGAPDGIRVSRTGLLFIAVAGGADVIDPSSGLLLGKINTPDDIIYNLESGTGTSEGVWLLTGGKAIYKATIAEGGRRSYASPPNKIYVYGAAAQEYVGGAVSTAKQLYQSWSS